jgi:DNA-binding transcriptional LysR family regulator
MDLNRLKMFYYVAQAESLTHSEINLTRSGISRHISILEHQLRVKLFKRHPRKLILTQEGEMLYNSVHKIMGDIEKALNEIKENHRAPSGNITIYTHSGWSSSILIRLVSDFNKIYNKINVSVIAGDSIPDFSLSSTHIAILPTTLPQKNLIQEKLFSFKMKLCASRAYIETYGVPKTLSELDSHCILAYGEHKHHLPIANWHLSLGMPEGEKRQPAIMINSLYYAVEQGYGIAPVCRPLINESDNLVDVLPEYLSQEIGVYYIYPKHLEKFERITLFCAYLKETIKEMFGNKVII